MEPIPETNESLTELEGEGDLELRGELQRLTAQAKAQTPGLVGVSLALLAEDLVLTYVTSDLQAAILDAMQYADDGPCVEAIVRADTIVTDTEALLDENRWQLFAQTSATLGIRSTLSMPFRRGGVVTGGVNLYGSASATFADKVEELAALFGAWAPGAVANADLSFESRLEAIGSPERLRGQRYVDRALGLLMSARDLDPEAAEERLQAAAARAGIGVFVLAKALVEAIDSPD